MTDKDQFTQRIDFVESPKSFWFGRFSWTDEYVLAPNLKDNGQVVETNVKQVMMSNTRTLSPSVVNEFRFGATKFYNNLAQELQYKRNVHQEVGLGLFIPPPISWGLPSMSISGFSGFGDNPSLPFTGDNSVFQFIDNVSWIRGNHSMRMGAEIRRDHYNMIGTQEIRGSLNIDRPVTGYSFADYMLGMISGTRSAGALGEGWYRATSQAYFIQDTWRMRPNVTLDLGLRYEYTPPWLDVKGEMMNIWVPPGFGTPSQQGKPCFIRVGSGDPYEGVATRFDPAICVARDGRLGDRLIASDKTNFAPRIGVVWSPSPKTTVRTGYGIFYAQDSTNPVFDMSRNIQGRITAQNPGLTLAQPYDGGATNPCGVQMPPQVCVTAPQVLGNQYDRRTPYVEQYLLNFQREVERQHGRGDRVLWQPRASLAAVHHAEPAGAWHEPSHPCPCSRTRAGELADDQWRGPFKLQRAGREAHAPVVERVLWSGVLHLFEIHGQRQRASQPGQPAEATAG